MGTVSFELQARGVSGVLVVMAERGLISELRCLMKACYCPGGRGYFDPISTSPDKWIPTADHFPIPKSEGGHLVPENVRLAHKLCNLLGSGDRPGHQKQRDAAKSTLEEWRAAHPGKRAAEAAWIEMQRAQGLGGYEMTP